MKARSLCGFAATLLAGALMLQSASAEPKYGPGATDTEIRIGNTAPYTGAFSEYAAEERGEAAYFRMINDRGGINGRKINLVSLNDESTQEPNPYDGSWEARFSTGGLSRVVSVSIEGRGGTWGSSSWVSPKFDQCFNRNMPLTVTRATAEEIVFHVYRSKIISGCEDSTIKLKRIDENTLDGTGHWGDGSSRGAPMKLVRK